ncbi:MAG: hgdB, partial [Deltaproteobacteria bacterium]|nr:hgdB [Deltaproteobacteria bacterium]
MMRDATISSRKRLGRKTVVVLPVHYPRELFTAMDVHTVELWGPPGPPRGPDAGRIQAYACAVVRNALAFLASGGADAADAVLFPHTCDSIQGLATLAPDFGGWGKQALRFLHPKGQDGPAARAFVRAELSLLADRLAELTGRPLERPRLAGAIGLHARIDRLRGDLLSRRAFLDMTDSALYLLLRRGEFLVPEDHLAELGAAARTLGEERVQRGVPLMITGYVPEPMTLFDSLASAGAFVAADDYAAVGRRVPLS